eukprot:351486-Chlamydomonas_euryale.AAC.7
MVATAAALPDEGYTVTLPERLSPDDAWTVRRCALMYAMPCMPCHASPPPFSHLHAGLWDAAFLDALTFNFLPQDRMPRSVPKSMPRSSQTAPTCLTRLSSCHPHLWGFNPES